MELTHGTLLGGQVRYAQPAHGYRTGIEPVLLAASIPARPGQAILEAGTGAGAALLCLTHRVTGLRCVGIEADADLARVAAQNGAGNEAIQVQAADVLALPELPPFDHAMTNPPWHGAAGTASPDQMRDRAKRAPPGLLAAWIRVLGRLLRHHGTLTLALPAAATAEAMAALAAGGLGSPALLPLWPRPGVAAKLVLLRAIRNGAGPCRILPGLVLHTADRQYTDGVQAILRGAARLDGFDGP